MIGGTSMSLVCGRNRSGRRMTEYQEAGCSRRMQKLETDVGRQLQPQHGLWDNGKKATGGIVNFLTYSGHSPIQH